MIRTRNFDWGFGRVDECGKWSSVTLDGVEIDVRDLTDLIINDYGFRSAKSSDILKITERYREGMEKINDQEEATKGTNTRAE